MGTRTSDEDDSITIVSHLTQIARPIFSPQESQSWSPVGNQGKNLRRFTVR